MPPKATSKWCHCDECRGVILWPNEKYILHQIELAASRDRSLHHASPSLVPASGRGPGSIVDISTPDITAFGTRPAHARVTQDAHNQATLESLLKEARDLEGRVLQMLAPRGVEHDIVHDSEYGDSSLSGKRQRPSTVHLSKLPTSTRAKQHHISTMEIAKFNDIVVRTDRMRGQKWPAVKQDIEAVLLRIHRLMEPTRDQSAAVMVNASHHFDLPIDKLALSSQLQIFSAALQYLTSGIARQPLETGLVLQRDVAQLRTEELGQAWDRADYGPTALKGVLQSFRPDIPWARSQVCPTCHTGYPVVTVLNGVSPIYTRKCTNRDEFPLRLGQLGSDECGTDLLDDTGEPLMQLWYHSIPDFIASLTSDPTLERIIDEHTERMRQSIVDPHSPARITDVYEAKLVREFPQLNGRHFLDCGTHEGRLFFHLFVDWFNPEGGRRRGRQTSTGIVAGYCLNLPSMIRHLYPHPLMIIQGPHEVSAKYWSHYADHIVDDLKIGWLRGCRLSRTALRPEGREYRYAMALKIADLPAARMSKGAINVLAVVFCDRCNAWDDPQYRGQKHVWKNGYGRYDWQNWVPRVLSDTKAHAYRYLSLSAPQRALHFKNHGWRWSLWWELPYWNPHRQVVVEAFHAFANLVAWHIRRGLKLNQTDLLRVHHKGPAFSLDVFTPAGSTTLDAREVSQLKLIHKSLTLSMVDPTAALHDGAEDEGEADNDDDDDEEEADSEPITAQDSDYNLGLMTRERLESRLKGYRKKALMEAHRIIASRDRDNVIPVALSAPVRDWVHALVAWRQSKPFHSNIVDVEERIATMETLTHLRFVISTMIIPSWLVRERPPTNYGSATAGSTKGTQNAWLGKLYLPVALGTLWSPRSPLKRDRLHPHCFASFDNTMHLAQMLLVAGSDSTSTMRQSASREHYVNYVRTLMSPPLNRYGHDYLPPNAHMAWHVLDGLTDAGPVPRTWGLAGERLIGKLQKDTKNNTIGQFEQTLHRNHILRAKIIQWARRVLLTHSLGDIRKHIEQAIKAYVPRGNDEVTTADIIEPEASLELDIDKESLLALHIPKALPKPPPDDLKSLLGRVWPSVPPASRKVMLMQFLMFERRFFSPETQHPGNSQAMFVPCEDDDVVPTPGLIKYVFYGRNQHYFAVQRLGRHPSQSSNPFVEYPDFPAEVRSTRLGDLEIVPVTTSHVKSHFARLALTKNTALVFDLCRQ